jgi:pimeloyl-ACP methyl ester carboxylesterase
MAAHHAVLLAAGPATRRLPHRHPRTGQGTLAQWRAGRQAALIPSGWFEQWADAAWATDQWAQTKSAGRARANGDAGHQEFWTSGKTMYDPAKITAPTLIAIGEWDNDTPPYMAQALFPLLVNSPGRRMVMLPEATHSMMLEKNRRMLFRTVQAFLDEGDE